MLVLEEDILSTAETEPRETEECHGASGGISPKEISGWLV